jgi:hypothetical protein
VIVGVSVMVGVNVIVAVKVIVAVRVFVAVGEGSVGVTVVVGVSEAVGVSVEVGTKVNVAVGVARKASGKPAWQARPAKRRTTQTEATISNRRLAGFSEQGLGTSFTFSNRPL